MDNGGAKEWLQYVTLAISAVSAISAAVAVWMTKTIHVLINSRLTKFLISERAAGGLEERDRERAHRKQEGREGGDH